MCLCVLAAGLRTAVWSHEDDDAITASHLRMNRIELADRLVPRDSPGSSGRGCSGGPCIGAAYLAGTIELHAILANLVTDWYYRSIARG